MISRQVFDEPVRDTDADQEFERCRGRLFGIGYRMLGSVMDAEDAVQETYLRWRRVDPSAVGSASAYLTATMTRLCIDQLRSARARREEYVGPWLPEPLLIEPESDVEGRLIRDESLSLAFLMLLERLDPVERAAFLLRDVFDYDYGEIAEIVEKSPANCRQIVHRARRHLARERRRFAPTRAESERLTGEFVQACTSGDLDALVSLLHTEVAAWTDGGPAAHAARRPIVGADRVARFLLGVLRKSPSPLIPHFAWVNQEPGLVIECDGAVQGVAALEIAEGRIVAIREINNPEKLRHLSLPRERPSTRTP